MWISIVQKLAQMWSIHVVAALEVRSTESIDSADGLKSLAQFLQCQGLKVIELRISWIADISCLGQGKDLRQPGPEETSKMRNENPWQQT